MATPPPTSRLTLADPPVATGGRMATPASPAIPHPTLGAWVLRRA